jgi:uncharacterized glyoxalase superfamily protein PhnB
MLKKLTPVVLVDAIEPVLPFWVDRLGFVKVAEVPEGEKIGFVILVKDGVELMYQTLDSVAKDEPKSLPPDGSKPYAALFIEIADFEATSAALKGADVLVPHRTTFYGSTEVIARDPAGNVVIFAKMAETSSAS